MKWNNQHPSESSGCEKNLLCITNLVPPLQNNNLYRIAHQLALLTDKEFQSKWSSNCLPCARKYPKDPSMNPRWFFNSPKGSSPELWLTIQYTKRIPTTLIDYLIHQKDPPPNSDRPFNTQGYSAKPRLTVQYTKDKIPGEDWKNPQSRKLMNHTVDG